MSKKVCYLKGQKVLKTLIFYTHTHTSNRCQAKKIAIADFNRKGRQGASDDLFYASFGFSAGLCGEVFSCPFYYSRALSYLPSHRSALKPNGFIAPSINERNMI